MQNAADTVDLNFTVDPTKPEDWAAKLRLAAMLRPEGDLVIHIQLALAIAARLNGVDRHLRSAEQANDAAQEILNGAVALKVDLILQYERFVAAPLMRLMSIILCFALATAALDFSRAVIAAAGF